MNFDLSIILLLITLLSLVIVIFAIMLSSSFLNTIILISSCSLLLSICYLFMDAPDVSMTEAAIGSSLSTILLFRFITTVGEKVFVSSKRYKVAGFIISTTFFCLMVYGILDITPYGETNEAFHNHINKYYIENTSKDIGIFSFVAAILASYRGYDTLGETTVIFLSAVALMVILKKDDNVSVNSRVKKLPSKNSSQ